MRLYNTNQQAARSGENSETDANIKKQLFGNHLQQKRQAEAKQTLEPDYNVQHERT